MKTIKISFLTKFYITIIISLFLITAVALIIQNYYMEDIYFHSKINILKNDVNQFANQFYNKTLEDIQSSNISNTFYDDHGVSTIVLNNKFEIIDESVFNNLNYLITTDSNGQYKKVIIDKMFDNEGYAIESNIDLNTENKILVKGMIIPGTNYIEAFEISVDSNVYKNYEIYWKWSEIYTTLEADRQKAMPLTMIDLVVHKNVRPNYDNQSRLLWETAKGYLYENKENEILWGNNEINTYNESYELNVYTKFIHIVEDEEEFYIVMLFTLEEIQSAFRMLNDFYIKQYMTMFIIVAIIGYVFTQKFKAPMKQLNNYAKEIAIGNFTKEDIRHSNDEIGELFESLNLISNNLSHKIQELDEKASLKEQEEKRMRLLLASLSHEFKTPLGVISGFTQIIRDGIQKDKTKYHCSVIQEEVKRLNTLILETIELTSFETQTIVLNIEPIEMNEFISHICNKFNTQIESKNLKVISKLKDIVVEADRSKIEQVIINLLSNAIYHANDNGIITIDATIKQNNVTFSFENTGSHIPVEALDNIWDIFYRVDVSRNRSSGGSGIGLAIVSSILKLHGSEKAIINTDSGVKVSFNLKKFCKEI